MYPVILIIASLALGAPSALSETVAEEASQNPETLSAYVEQYFADDPVLVHIAYCESRMRQYGKDGEVLRGMVDSDDVGIMQINTRFHGEKAAELGYNIYGVAGNLAYAKYLYEKQGTKPWRASSPCWAKMKIVAAK